MLTRKYESMNETTNSITEKIPNVAADLSVKFTTHNAHKHLHHYPTNLLNYYCECLNFLKHLFMVIMAFYVK